MFIRTLLNCSCEKVRVTASGNRGLCSSGKSPLNVRSIQATVIGNPNSGAGRNSKARQQKRDPHVPAASESRFGHVVEEGHDPQSETKRRKARKWLKSSANRSIPRDQKSHQKRKSDETQIQVDLEIAVMGLG